MLNFNDEIVKSRFNSINGVKMGSMCEIFSSNFCKDKASDDDGTCIEFGDEGDKLNIEIKDGKAVNLFIDGKYVYGPVTGNQTITIK